MNIVKISPKFQVVLPTDICQQLNIQVGQKLSVRVHREHIELLLIQPMSAARGFLQGMDTHLEREKDHI